MVLEFGNLIQYGQTLKAISKIKLSDDMSTRAQIESTYMLTNAVSNLTPKQQALALATKGLSVESIKNALVLNGVSEEEAVQVAVETGLIQKKKELSIATAQETLTQALGNKEKAKSIMKSAGIVASDGAETVSKKKVSVATLETKLANEGLSTSEIKLITTQMGLGTSTVTLSNYFKGLAASTWASVKAIGAFLTTNPVGWCILAVGAVASVVAVVDLFTTSLEEQKEISEKLQDEYNELTSQLSKVESELQSVSDRIDELNEKEHLTFVEQEELETLEKTNFQLERQNELLKEQQAIKAKELSDSVKKEFEKKYQSKMNLGNGKSVTKEEVIQEKLDYYNKYKDNEGYLREWSDEFEETKQYLLNSALDIQDYISRYGVDDEVSQSWQDLFESIDRTLNPAAYKTKDFNDILNYKEFKKDVEEINNLLASGELNKEVLNKQFPEFLEAMQEVGFTTEEVVEQFYGMNNAVDEQGSALDNTSSTIEDFSKVLDTASKKQSALKSAMDDMTETGYISSDTYATLLELGGNFTKCLELQNGKLILNTEKLKDLEKQEYLNTISANKLSIAELQLAAVSLKGVGTEWISEKITELEQQNAIYETLIDEIDKVKPDDKNEGKEEKEEKPQSVLDFEEDLAEYQHEIAMGRKEEDTKYYDWLDKRAHEAYNGLADYQSDLWKYEEEVYSGRKKLAEEDFNNKHKSFEKYVDELQEYADELSETSINADGVELNTQEKFREIAAVYTDIQSAIQREINRIVQVGVEGNEELLEELENKLKEYADKVTDTFKSAVETEKSLLENQKSTLSDVYDKEIDKIKKQQEDSKNAADAEIDLIQEKIDNLKEVNDEKQREYEIEEARQNLEKTRQRTRMVYGSDGRITYKQDDEAIKEAQQNLDKLLLEKQVNTLESQKSLLEEMRDKESKSYDKLIEDIESQKEQDERQFDILIQRLEDYLNPNSDTSNSDVWSAIAKMDGASYQNGKWIDKDGIEIDIAALLSKANEIANDNKSEGNTAVTNTANKKNDNEDKVNKLDLEKILKGAGFKESVAKSLTFEKLSQIFGFSGTIPNTSIINQPDVSRWITKLPKKEINNNSQPVNMTFGDININNPVGDTKKLANEIKNELQREALMEVPNVAMKIMHSNLK